MDITYRKLTGDDIPVFLAYFKKNIPLLFPEYSADSNAFEVEMDYSPEVLTKLLKKNDRVVFLALNNQIIVGFILIMETIAGVGFADWLGVDKTHRKQGIATKLMSLWQAHALAEGAHALHLWSAQKNISFYEKRGFINGGYFPKSWHGHDSYLMYKHIAEPEEKNYLKKYFENKRKSS